MKNLLVQVFYYANFLSPIITSTPYNANTFLMLKIVECRNIMEAEFCARRLEMGKRKVKDSDEVTISDRIAILGIYMDEWIYRDQSMFSTMFKTSLIALVVIVLPYIKGNFGMKGNLPFDDWIFPVVGMAIEIVFIPLYMGNLERQKKSSETLIKIINSLPEELRRVEIKEKTIAKRRMARYLAFTLQGLVLLLGIIVLVRILY